jgi:hypothetical protein
MLISIWMDRDLMTRCAGLETKLTVDMGEVRKALVMLAIERALLEVGRPCYDLVVQKLEEKYGCYICDCYEIPSYLRVILKELFGDSYNSIIKSIAKNLDEYSDRIEIRRFLDSISS